MRLYPWHFTRRLDPTTMTFIYTVTYEANVVGSMTAEKLAAEPEAERTLLQEFSARLIEHMMTELEVHRAVAPDLLDKTPDA